MHAVVYIKNKFKYNEDSKPLRQNKVAIIEYVLYIHDHTTINVCPHRKEGVQLVHEAGHLWLVVKDPRLYPQA